MHGVLLRAAEFTATRGAGYLHAVCAPNADMCTADVYRYTAVPVVYRAESRGAPPALGKRVADRVARSGLARGLDDQAP
jgi:hypothetical protein